MASSVAVYRTGGPGDAENAAEQRSGDVDVIVSMGGDGTFREVLNGANPDECCLAVLPTGTGNVLAGELGLSGNPLENLEHLVGGAVIDFDVGICNDEKFAAVFGAGIDAEVVRRVEARRQRHMSQLGYVPSLLNLALDLPRWSLEMEADGRTIARNANVIVAGNTATYGGPVQFTPLADPCDGMLDVAMMRLASVLDLPGAAFSLLLKCTDRWGRTEYLREARFTVTAEEQVPYQLDGDFAGWLPADVKCIPGGIRLLAPAAFCRQHGGVGRCPK